MADKLRKASSTGVANVAVVASSRAVGATVLEVKTGGLTNWATTTSVDFSTYTLTNGVISNKCEWTGLVDLENDSITNLELTNGIDVGNTEDDVVVCIETAAWVNDTIDVLLGIFDKTGSLKSSSIAGSSIVNESISTVKLANLSVTISKIDTIARQQSLDIDGSTEIVFSTASTQPAAKTGKTIIWFAPTT